MTSPQKVKPNGGPGKGRGKGPGRPCNAFVIFRRERSPKYPALPRGLKSALISREWEALSDERKAGYFQRAEDEKAAFNAKYPNHKYRPRTREEIEADEDEALRVREEKKAAKARAREMKNQQHAPKRARKSNNVSTSTATSHSPDVPQTESSQALLHNEVGDVSGLPHPTKTSATSVPSAHESYQPPVHYAAPPAQCMQSIGYGHVHSAPPASHMVPGHYNGSRGGVAAYQPSVLPYVSQQTVPVDAYSPPVNFYASVGPTNQLKRTFDQIEQDDVEVAASVASGSGVVSNVHNGYSDEEWSELLSQTETDAEVSSAPNPATPTANGFEFCVGMDAQFTFNANGSTYLSDQYVFFPEIR